MYWHLPEHTAFRQLSSGCTTKSAGRGAAWQLALRVRFAAVAKPPKVLPEVDGARGRNRLLLLLRGPFRSYAFRVLNLLETTVRVACGHSLVRPFAQPETNSC